MTVSVKAPTSTTGSIQLNGSDVLTIESDNSVDIDSGTLHVDATNNRVGVGTSSPNTLFHVQGSNSGGNVVVATLRNNNTAGSTQTTLRFTNSTADGTSGGGELSYLRNSADQGASFIVKTQSSGGVNTERMRIDSSGNVLIGVTASGAITNGVTVVSPATTTVLNIGHIVGSASNTDFVVFRYNGTNIGSITQSGTTTTAYNTSSDYRLKENVAPMSGSIDRLKQLKPSTWAWVQDGSHGEGFLAHEAAEVVPEAVTGEKDAMQTEEYEVTPAVLDNDGNVVTEAVMGTREVPDYQGIDQAKLVPLLTAALQEAITKIEDLETRIQTLESA